MEDEEANYWQIMKEKSVQVPHEDYDAETKLNLKQEVAFITIMKGLIQEEVMFFSLINQEVQVKHFFIEHYLHKWDQIALATTTSGVAVVILLGNQTTHSWFILPLNLKTRRDCRVTIIGIPNHMWWITYDKKISHWNGWSNLKRYHG